MDQHVIDYLNFCQHEWEALLDKLNEFSVLADESNRKISGDKK